MVNEAIRSCTGQFGQSEGISNPERLWVFTSLAETAARLGDTSAAGVHFRAALSLDLRDPYLLVAYADFLLDEGRPAEARELVRDESRIDELCFDWHWQKMPLMEAVGPTSARLPEFGTFRRGLKPAIVARKRFIAVRRPGSR